jgi:putative transposase
MRRGQYSVEQIIGILKQYEGGRSAKELCRHYGFSDQTLKRWKAKYKGMHVEEAKRLKALEDENRRLKHVVAELSLDKRALEAALGKKW